MPKFQNTESKNIELTAENVNVYYGSTLAVKGVNLDIHSHEITAFIGPSGCGKSTMLRCFNRLNDLIPDAKVEGNITFRGQNLYEKKVDPVQVRRHIGMVFQKPNPFAKSIYDNIAFAARVNGFRGKDMDDLVENALRQAALWDEVKDKLKSNGLSLSGGQQQRLCIARAIAIQPEVILMDEPCSALDPISTLSIEQLLLNLKDKYTIIIVTHNMQQASRVSDRTAFFNARATEKGKQGYLVEYSDTKTLFQSPVEEATQQYVTGAFG
ncbi:phosphate ABC transporter ATP-binding protein [Euhalothece natronophila Z-M001]|uniref:Phosphate ABC transporter ATP-binding protein n=2 Tax=Euhalothece TaxID=65097 RepID=A0A5B8NSW6_9CHRO|nr:phosphate ABC transporter ATP-binding protein PstB [Euhalothece natronophila]QDZ41459.1 phosphate ABC transporter ATP-binding protein [Euhalothece natronophila Z-M001]